jgi:hypothetical protein
MTGANWPLHGFKETTPLSLTQHLEVITAPGYAFSGLIKDKSGSFFPIAIMRTVQQLCRKGKAA